MASKGPKNEQNAGRVVPNVATGKSSRVSKAAGSIGSSSVHVEQRSSSTHSRQRSGTNKRANGSASGSKSSSKKGQATPASTSRKPAGSSPAPADSRLIGQVRDRWDQMQPHEQQRFFGVVLLVLTLFLFLAVSFWRNLPLFRPLTDFFFSMFSWATLPLVLGLIVFAVAHLVEGVRNIRFIRWSLVIGLVVLLLLLLVESQLLIGHTAGGIIGGLLAFPLLNLGFAGHILVLGLFLIVTLVTFRIKVSDIRRALNWVYEAFVAPRQVESGGAGTVTASPFRGQRPLYSRYTSNGTTDVDAENAAGKVPRKRAAQEVEEGEEEGDLIEFEDDFDEPDDDPRNNINLHKDQVVTASRGRRTPQSMDRSEHLNAVKGARQQPLPFQNNQPIDVTGLEEMEPLMPNPQARPQGQLRLVRRGADASGKAPEIESPWKQPDTTILNSPEIVKLQILGDDTTTLAKTIQNTLRSFRVEAEVRPEDISIGPTVIRFGIRPTGKPMLKEDGITPVKDAAGNIVYEVRTRVSRIMALQNDLALVLESKTIRMEAPVPGRPYVGVEIPNKNSRMVTLREVLESKEYLAAKAKSRLTVALGRDVAGLVRVGDLAKMPHLLIAGATGAGKSVMINAIISSIITQASPEDVRMLMVDPKMVELSMYNGIPHLLSPVVIEVEKVVGLLKLAIAEMEKRYRLFSQLSVRNLEGYRRLRAERIGAGDETLKNLPAIVIIIDELADLMMAAPDEVEGLICRLAQLARATGIHLVVATQRPSVDVITGLIKANIPTRISFMVSSAVDSRTIIDMGGAERLLGRGDMLYLPADAGKPERIQGAFVADEEAERLVEYWKTQAAEHSLQNSAPSSEGQPPSTPGVEPGWEVREVASDEFELEDELLEQAEEVVQEYERASISLLQRRLKIGYSRAARLIDLLEERGIISKAESGGRSREVLETRSSRHSGRDEGHSMADEAADIMEEERLRQEFLKKQAEREQMSHEGRYGPSSNE